MKRFASWFAAALLLSGAAVLIAGAGGVTAFTQATAAQLGDRGAYVEAVLGNRGVVGMASAEGGS